MKPLLLAVLLALPVQAQHTHAPPTDALSLDDPAVSAFVDQVRAATAPFQDLDAAVAAGYRTLGPDMPNMGEHWVHPGNALRREIDPTRPAMLTYLRVSGEPVLTGVAYTTPVRAGETPPAPPFPAEWHYHAGRLDDEAFGLVPHAMHAGEGGGTRLAMAHAWVWTPNPDGVFAADNWALPYVRLGLSVPDDLEPDAAKALFLLDGGVNYYTRFVEVAAQPSAADLGAVRNILDMHRAQVAATLRSGEISTPALAARWEAMWDDVRSAVGEERWGPLRAALGLTF